MPDKNAPADPHNKTDRSDSPPSIMTPQTPKIRAALQAFEADLKTFNIPYYVVGSLTQDLALLRDSTYLYCNWPDALIEIWEANRGFSLNPIAQYSRTSMTSFHWHDILPKASKHAARMFKTAQQFGLREGYFVRRTNELGETIGGVSIGGPAFPYRDIDLIPIELMCIEFTDKLDGLVRSMPIPDIKLSQQETETLKCAANGDSISQTSRILDISESAVKDAQFRARKKLNARNTTHACVLAAKIGII